MYDPAAAAYRYDVDHRLLLIATCATVTSLLLGGLLVWRLLVEQVYLVPPGGPGLAKPGVLDEATARDYARRWLISRWSFRPETYSDMKEELLASVHQTYREELKAEIDQDGREVQQFRVSSSLAVASKDVKLLQHRGQTVTLTLHALRTLAWGGQEQLPEFIDVRVVVTLQREEGRLKDVVMAKTSTTPGFSAVGLAKGKK